MGSLLAFARGAVGFLHGEIVAMVVGGPCGKCVGPSVGFLHGVLFAREPCWVSVGLVRPAAQARCPAAQARCPAAQASSSGQMPSSSGQIAMGTRVTEQSVSGACAWLVHVVGLLR